MLHLTVFIYNLFSFYEENIQLCIGIKHESTKI